MGKKKMLFVYNPKAGKERIRSNLLDIIDIFAKAGYEVTVHPTQEQGDAIEAVKNRDRGFDIVTCSGGDGTLDEVVSGMWMSKTRVPIGYVPAGSTNDFAMSLGIPAAMHASAEAIVTGREYACDIGVMNGDTFVYIAAFGLFTDVSYLTKQDIKNVLGHMAYIFEGAKRLSEIRSYHMKVTADDMVIEDDFVFGMVTNSISVGGFKDITGKHIKLDDGVFEVTLVKFPDNMLDMSNLMAALLNRDIDTEQMYCFKTSHLVLESKESIAWTRDGEFGGEHTYVDIKNENKALKIMVPNKN
ncbi:diacylglycerol kinase family protein [Butyrivibrio sp. INlla16]|uniref:diacylglycerol/lipid kinase family protein n=1 Tax=Butyrivibrio sp. INlla16 TaxID=1520807 RepID=UPI00089270BE|nr:diacylglycerol kinase family protein [Butyrivibrio sp. INlla16]SDB59735.1 lipid kinase, YegS/Rv2252/BmrU family [Butyrivibrio sp. INlla16]